MGLGTPLRCGRRAAGASAISAMLIPALFEADSGEPPWAVGEVRSRVPTYVGGRRLGEATAKPRDSSHSESHRPQGKNLHTHRAARRPAYVGSRGRNVQLEPEPQPSMSCDKPQRRLEADVEPVRELGFKLARLG